METLRVLLLLAGLNVTVLNAFPTTLPLYASGNLLLVEGSVNNLTGFLIFDTGASHLLLNSAYYEGYTSSNVVADGAVAGQQAVATCTATLQLGDLEWQKEEGFLLDLAHLEKETQRKIIGLVGSRLFRRRLVVVDFQHMTLMIEEETGNPTAAEWEGIVPEQLSLTFKGNLPCIEVEIGGKTLRIGIDTGSECNLLEERFGAAMEGYLSDKRLRGYRDITGQVWYASQGDLNGIVIGSLSCQPMSTLLADLSSLNDNLPGARLDGLMGYELLKQFRVAIYYDSRKVLLWPYSEGNRMLIAQRLEREE